MGNCLEIGSHDVTDFFAERITSQCNGICFHCNSKIFRLMNVHLSDTFFNSFILVTCSNCENVSKFYSEIQFALIYERNGFQLLKFICVRTVLKIYF